MLELGGVGGGQQGWGGLGRQLETLENKRRTVGEMVAEHRHLCDERTQVLEKQQHLPKRPKAKGLVVLVLCSSSWFYFLSPQSLALCYLFGWSKLTGPVISFPVTDQGHFT